MSDIIPTQHESAVAVLRERERELDAEYQGHTSRANATNNRLEEVRDLIATLSRKPRARKVRATEVETAPETANDSAPRPTVFNSPSVESGEEAAA